MPPPTYRRKVDINHKEVREKLREAGWMVRDYSGVGMGFPDLLAYRVEEFYKPPRLVIVFSVWVEVKQPKEKLTEAETFFFDHAPGPKIIAYSGQDAIDKITQLFEASYSRREESHHDKD